MFRWSWRASNGFTHVAVRSGLPRPPQQASFRIAGQVHDRDVEPAAQRFGDFDAAGPTVEPEVDQGQIGTRLRSGLDGSSRARHGGGHRVSQIAQTLLQPGSVRLLAGNQYRRVRHRAPPPGPGRSSSREPTLQCPSAARADISEVRTTRPMPACRAHPAAGTFKSRHSALVSRHVGPLARRESPGIEGVPSSNEGKMPSIPALPPAAPRQRRLLKSPASGGHRLERGRPTADHGTDAGTHDGAILRHPRPVVEQAGPAAGPVRCGHGCGCTTGAAGVSCHRTMARRTIACPRPRRAARRHAECHPIPSR